MRELNGNEWIQAAIAAPQEIHAVRYVAVFNFHHEYLIFMKFPPYFSAVSVQCSEGLGTRLATTSLGKL